MGLVRLILVMLMVYALNAWALVLFNNNDLDCLIIDSGSEEYVYYIN